MDVSVDDVTSTNVKGIGIEKQKEWRSYENKSRYTRDQCLYTVSEKQEHCNCCSHVCK